MWWVIALAYKEVTHAYGAPMSAMSVTKVLLLMGASMIGSMVQLPGLGGGSRLATISALEHVFDIVPTALTVRRGIMLWRETSVSIVSVRLLRSHHKRPTPRKLPPH